MSRLTATTITIQNGSDLAGNSWGSGYSAAGTPNPAVVSASAINNAGVISAGQGRLVIDGYVYGSGYQQVNPIGENATLELNGTDSEDVELWTQFPNSATLMLDQPASFSGRIFAFTGQGPEYVDLPGVTVKSLSYAGSTLAITTTAGTTYDLKYYINPDLSNLSAYTAPAGYEPVAASDGSGGTLISFSEGGSTTGTACFVRGTRIRTAEGERRVEELQPGDLLVTRSGALQPLRWAGRRTLVTALIAAEERAAQLPVRIARGALGGGLPERDLLVSPEHCILLDGVLIPAGHLVNGISITRCDSLELIEYIHLELPAHDVIFAEGAPTESYLDCGNRNMFDNIEDYVARYGLGEAGCARPCLPVVDTGRRLQEVRRRLLEQAHDMEAGEAEAPAAAFLPATPDLGAVSAAA